MASSSRRPVARSFKDVVTGVDGDPLASVCFEQGAVNGIKALIFSDEDLIKLSKPFELTLLGRFSSHRPELMSVRGFVRFLKFSGAVRVDHFDTSNVIFRFANDLDYSRFFAHRSYNVVGNIMKVIKWTPFLNLSVESPVTPIWISFPGLKFSLYYRRALWELGKCFGTPLQVDSSTALISNLSCARILVEVDVSAKLESKIWLVSSESSYLQDVIYEDIPKYFINCKQFGHLEEQCGSSEAENNVFEKKNLANKSSLENKKDGNIRVEQRWVPVNRNSKRRKEVDEVLDEERFEENIYKDDASGESLLKNRFVDLLDNEYKANLTCFQCSV